MWKEADRSRGFLQNWIFEIPYEFPSRVSRVGGGGDGVASVDGDAASRGLGLRYKANIFPE